MAPKALYLTIELYIISILKYGVLLIYGHLGLNKGSLQINVDQNNRL